MEDVERLLATSVKELERILSSKTVVGEPITVGEATIIPLSSVGFAFGAGGGTGTGPGKIGQGTGGGTGGGGGIKPVAVLIIDKQGVHLEPVKGRSGFMEKVTDIVNAGIKQSRESKDKQSSS